MMALEYCTFDETPSCPLLTVSAQAAHSLLLRVLRHLHPLAVLHHVHQDPALLRV